MSINILHVLPRLNNSGVTWYVIDLIANCKKVDDNLEFFVAAQDAELSFKFNSDNRYVLPVASKNPATLIKNAWRIKKICEKHGIDLIHVHSRAPAWSVLLVSKIYHIPYVATYHGAYGQNKMKWFYNKVMVMGKKVIAVSHYIKERVAKLYPIQARNVVLIHQGIDDAKFILTNADHMVVQKIRETLGNFVIFLPGRLGKGKGHCLLIDALIQWAKPVTMLINRPANDKERAYLKLLESKAEKTNVKIIVLEEDQKIGYNLADVVVVPSIKPEAFGRVVLEALVCDRPLLVADHGGVKDIISDQAFLFKPHDATDLKDKLNRLISTDPVLLKSKIGMQKNEVMALFDPKKCAQKMVDVYRQVIDA